jgi:serine/threonine-protein kinase
VPRSDPKLRYELFEELGAGTSAVVYRAMDRQLGREVAVKHLHRNHGADATRRLEREAKVAAAFRHPNAVEVYEVGMLDDRPFMAMELVRGGTLAQHLQRLGAPAGTGAAIAIGTALADVLAAAHAAGLVHRDVKPSNVFVEGELGAPSRVRLVDFGLAFLLEPSTETLGRLTQEGFVLGTPAYMAPEQSDGRPIGPTADVYALGCVLYELVSGRTPFLGDIPRMLTGHLYLPPIPLEELDLVDELPPALGAQILRMLVKPPDERPSATEVLEQLTTAGAPRQRSASHRPRSERSLTSPPNADALRRSIDAPIAPAFRVAIGDLAAPEAASIRNAGLTVAAVDDAELVLVQLADDGTYAEQYRGKRVVGLHPAPTPKMIANAIRNGVLLVLRTPISQDKLVSRLGALAHSRQLTYE